jgi:mediator of RNA polymerase II transcription subunit 12
MMDMGNIYHVVAELVRSHTFSVGRYLQWLVARGAVEQHRQEKSSPEFSSAPLSSDIELLSQIPVNRLPQHLRNLRDTLIVRAGLRLSEDEVTSTLKADIRHRLPDIFDTDVDYDSMVCHVDENKLPWAVKAEIGQWIRGGVSEHYGNDPR